MTCDRALYMWHMQDCSKGFICQRQNIFTVPIPSVKIKEQEPFVPVNKWAKTAISHMRCGPSEQKTDKGNFFAVCDLNNKKVAAFK